MDDISTKKTNGYYHIHIYSASSERFFKTNNERSFIGVQLQQLLAARSVLEDPLYAKSLASHIDLLAYSLSEKGVHLLAYCIDASSMQHLISILLERLGHYQSEYGVSVHTRQLAPAISMKKLSGQHEALSLSANIHLLHKDWEYDRYSSIGFYLHDRRGDWMKLWRLTQLYENDSAVYRDYIQRARNSMIVS